MKFLKSTMAIVALLAIGSVDAKQMGARAAAYRGGITTTARGKTIEVTSGNIDTAVNDMLERFNNAIIETRGKSLINMMSTMMPSINNVHKETISLLNNNQFSAQERLDAINRINNSISTIMNSDQYSDAAIQQLEIMKKKSAEAQAHFKTQVDTIARKLEAEVMGQGGEGQKVGSGQEIQPSGYETYINASIEKLNTAPTRTAFRESIAAGAAKFATVVERLAQEYGQNADNAVDYLATQLTAKGGPAEGKDRGEVNNALYQYVPQQQ